MRPFGNKTNCHLYKAMIVLTFLLLSFASNAQSSRTSERLVLINSLIERADSCYNNQDYQQAIRYCNEGLRLIKRPQKYLDKFTSLNLILAQSYLDSNAVTEGITLLESLLRKGIPSSKKCQALSLLGKAYYLKEDYEHAVYYYKSAADSYQLSFGEDKSYWEDYQLPLAYTLSLNNQSDIASDLLAAIIEYAKQYYTYDDYIEFLLNRVSGFINTESREAIWVDKVGLSVFEELASFYKSKADWANYVRIVGIAAQVADFLGDYYKAKLLNLEAIEHYTEESNIPLSSFYSSAARASSRLRYYDDAEMLLAQAEEIAKMEPDSVSAIKDIRLHRALLCIDKNDNQDYAIQVFDELLCDNYYSDQDKATFLYNLGLCYTYSSPAKSKDYFIKALALYEKTEGHGILYARTLNQLGMIAHNEKDYRSAMGYYELAIDIFRRLSSDKNYSYILTLRNAAYSSWAMSQYGRALAFAEEARDIQRNITGIIFPELWDLLSRCYGAVRDFRNHEITERQIDRIWQNDKNRQLLSLLNQVNDAYSIGDVENAIEVFAVADSLYQSFPDSPNKYSLQEFIEHYGQMLGSKSSDEFGYFSSCIAQIDSLDYGMSLVLERVAKTAYNKGDDISANYLYKVIFPYMRNDPSTLYQAYYAACIANDIEFCKLLASRIADFIKQRLNAVVGLAEEEQEIALRGVLSFNKLLFATRDASHLDGLLYDITLASKNLLLRSELVMAETIASSSNQEIKERFLELKSIKYRLNNFKENLAPEIRDSLWLRQIALNREILTTISDYSNSAILKQVSYSDVAEALKTDEIAIEIVDYPISPDDKQYVALTLKHGDTRPGFVELCCDSQLQQYSDIQVKKLFNPNSHSSQELYQLIWAPLVSSLNGVRRIYISTSGRLSILPIEAYVSPLGRFVEDDYEIQRVSSTSVLCQQSHNDIVTDATVFGGLIYNSTSSLDNLKDNANSYYAEHSGYLIDRSVNSEISYLPWTKTEAEQISKILKKKHIISSIIIGEEGTETYFKSLSGSATSLIHIATHGFYQPREQANRIGYYENNSDEYIVPSMQRSGLLLAGCANAWNGKPTAGPEDGVLTASEIADLDLSNTRLVVLSACETGLGDITEDGVEGLQRAFKKAGVQSIIMSLWKVDDKATALLMTEFYNNLASGMSIKDAFVSSKNKVKNVEEYRNPYYWASFILLD